MADVPPEDDGTHSVPSDTPVTGWARGVPTPSPDEGAETPATGWVARPRVDESQDGPPDTPVTGWARASSPGPPEMGSETPATGWMWARPVPAGAAGEAGTPEDFAPSEPAEPAPAEVTAATGWVVAGTTPPAAWSTAASNAPAPDGQAVATAPGWPQAPAISWAQAPVPPATAQAPAGWAPPHHPRRRRPWLLGTLAVAILALLMVAGGGLGFAAGGRPAPTPTPHAQPALQPTMGPIGSIDSPVVTLKLPTGWLEQQQSGTDVKLVHFPNGYMDINVQSTTAVGASTPQTVLQQAEQGITNSPNTAGLVSTCVQPVAHTIAGRAGLEEGFQFEERGTDGKTVYTNCEVAWVSVANGEVYWWEVFNTLDQLQASTAAAIKMQRSAHWQE